ncbi:MAG: hypothetical protein DRI86_01920 [Bacteroidetes bacterium]|nr:MAG: hypothetical protein DRI86_01920 [Bacteroidota bacterium]
MIRFTDVLIEIGLLLSFFIGSIFVLEFTEYPFIILGLFLLFFLIHINIKRKKRIRRYVEKEFEKLGYKIISERPLKSSESKVEVSASMTVSEIPISRLYYARQFARVFKVIEVASNKIFELNTISRKKMEWRNRDFHY